MRKKKSVMEKFYECHSYVTTEFVVVFMWLIIASISPLVFLLTVFFSFFFALGLYGEKKGNGVIYGEKKGNGVISVSMLDWKFLLAWLNFPLTFPIFLGWHLKINTEGKK